VRDRSIVELKATMIEGISKLNNVLRVEGSDLEIGEDSHIRQTQALLVLGSDSNVTFMDSSLSDSLNGLSLFKSKGVIKNSTFTSLGDKEVDKTRAITNTNSDLTIEGSTFTMNKANHGGALSTSCFSTCSVDIKDSSFIENSATFEGGAIQYLDYRPMMENLSFSQNTAAYGPDIGSYATKFSLDRSQDMKIEGLASG